MRRYRGAGPANRSRANEPQLPSALPKWHFGGSPPMSVPAPAVAAQARAKLSCATSTPVGSTRCGAGLSPRPSQRRRIVSGAASPDAATARPLQPGMGRPGLIPLLRRGGCAHREPVDAFPRQGPWPVALASPTWESPCRSRFSRCRRGLWHFRHRELLVLYCISLQYSHRTTSRVSTLTIEVAIWDARSARAWDSKCIAAL